MLLVELDVVGVTVDLYGELIDVLTELTGLAVPVDAVSLSLSVELERLVFMFFSFSCLAFCLCFALRFLNQTCKIGGKVLNKYKQKKQVEFEQYVD